jgi:transposase-like protein
MSKRKHSPEWMLARVREYLMGEGSFDTIATANGIGKKTLETWVQKFREQGEATLGSAALFILQLRTHSLSLASLDRSL